MILNEADAKRILEKVISFSKADSVSSWLVGSNSNNLRFALNSITTNGFADELTLSVTSYIGKKTGSVNTNKFDDESVKAAVQKSENIAKLSPENKEFMPPLEPQGYVAANNYSASTESLESAARAAKVSYILDQAPENNVVAAGYYQDSTNFFAIMNSKGLFAYNKGTLAGFSSTVRTKEGSGSSRVEKSYVNIDNLETKILSDKAISKSKLSINPQEISPGRYTVILEPAAAADIVSLCVNFMDSRSADEGRSFFSKKGGGNTIGDKLVDSRVNIYSDPVDPNAPARPFTSEGYPLNKTEWFSNGVLMNLNRNRFWAQKNSQPIVPFPSNVIMAGTDKSLAQMIAETDTGVLITRFWYIRTVDQQTMLLTGLTRDGIFEIKDGKIFKPVKNFRFNESPMNVLSNIIDIGQPEKATGSETGDMQIFVPALKVSNFNLSSLSDAI